jgi:hypothetical protein
MFLYYFRKPKRHGGRESDLLLSERSGVRKPDGIKFFPPFKTNPGAHPASCTMVAEAFPGIKRPERGDDHSVQASTETEEKMELNPYSTSVPSWPCYGVNLLYVLRS